MSTAVEKAWRGRWAGRTAAVIASGPSLTQADCDAVRDSGWRTIVTNTTYEMCPWADVLYGFDSKWWNKHGEAAQHFKGEKLTRTLEGRRFGASSLYLQGWLPCFLNSGADSISLAVVAGAARVVLLGCDAARTGGKTHWHGDHPKGLNNANSISEWPKRFALAGRFAASNNVEVINCSRETVLTCFTRLPLEKVLSEASEAVAA